MLKIDIYCLFRYNMWQEQAACRIAFLPTLQEGEAAV